MTAQTTQASHAPLAIPEMLHRRAAERPEAPLFRCNGVARDGRAMLDAVARAGGLLRREGVREGDPVALMCSNRTELLDFILGCAWIGAVAVPVNTAARGEQLQHILTNSGVRLLISEPEFLPHLEALGRLPKLEAVWLLDWSAPVTGPSLQFPVTPVPPRAEPVPAAEVGLADTAAILYTSGTTGVSKGVTCPQAQFYWWGVNMADQLELKEDDVLYTCLPLFHTNALNAFMQAVVSGASYVLGPKFSASQFWRRVREEEATVTYLLGAMVSILAGREPSEEDSGHRVRLALSPATPPSLVVPFRERFGIQLLDGYGSTETNSVIGSTPSNWRPGWMGHVRPGYSIRVADEQGLPVAAGVPGELLVRSDQPHALATGYFNMPEATAKAWQDLWFHSGDRVVVDADGWVRFVDRIKDVIRRRGENISSLEVERALREHPAVADAAVYAVESELGEDEVMAALIVKEPLDFAELVEFCHPRLAGFAIPRFLRIVDDLPRTENGKVRKPVLKEQGRAATQWDREAAQPRKQAAAN